MLKSGLNARKRLVKRATARDLVELIRIKGVKRDIDARKPCLFQLLCHAWQKHPVGGHGNAFNAINFVQFSYEVSNSFAHQWLSAREAQALNAHLRRNFNDVNNLIEAQDFIVCHLLHAFFGHAINAAKIAPIRERNAQIVYSATVAIFHRILPSIILV